MMSGFLLDGNLLDRNSLLVEQTRCRRSRAAITSGIGYH